MCSRDMQSNNTPLSNMTYKKTTNVTQYKSLKQIINVLNHQCKKNIIYIMYVFLSLLFRDFKLITKSTKILNLSPLQVLLVDEDHSV